MRNPFFSFFIIIIIINHTVTSTVKKLNKVEGRKLSVSLLMNDEERHGNRVIRFPVGGTHLILTLRRQGTENLYLSKWFRLQCI